MHQQLLARAHEIVDRMVTRLQFRFEPGVSRGEQSDSLHRKFGNFILYTIDGSTDVSIKNVELTPVGDAIMAVNSIRRIAIAYNFGSNQQHLLIQAVAPHPWLEYTRLQGIVCETIYRGGARSTEQYSFEQFIDSILRGPEAGFISAVAEPRMDSYTVPSTQRVSAIRLVGNQVGFTIGHHINNYTRQIFTLTFSA